MTSHAAPVGGATWNRATRSLLLIVLVATVAIVWRFAAGLGRTTGLNDGYPWGLWIAFDVVSGTALACGGYAVAFLVYVLNRGRYHPLVRPALLTSALGYSVATFAIVADVGRPWLIWRIPFGGTNPSFGYNWNSALLEVALCVMSYVIVLWLELSPAFLERWQDSRSGFLRGLSRRFLPIMERALMGLIALGILLPTMHQSSLGTVILLAGPRLHALWHTPMLPLLFLLSCFAMGYAMVVLESTLSSYFFKRRPETAMLSQLSRAMVWVLGAFLVLRLVDLIARGKLPFMLYPGPRTAVFWGEMLLFVVPLVMLLSRRRRGQLASLWRAAFLIAVAGVAYRIDAYLVAFKPGPGYAYFPTLPEMVITVGLIALETLIYVLLVKQFPILSGATPAASQR